MDADEVRRIDEVLAALEKATAGSFALNRAIADWWRTLPEGCDFADDEVPDWSGSIDAALTLVPEGWHWYVANRARAGDKEIFPPSAYLSPHGMHDSIKTYRANAATPALALCITALEARRPTLSRSETPEGGG